MRKPCGWSATPCESCCSEALQTLDDAVVEVLSAQAVSILWAATGRQYGLCETVLRPCRRNCGSYWGGLPTPMRVSGEWLNIGCNTCASACGCTTVSEFIAENVEEVVAVNIDGDELDPFDTVLVYDRRRIVRSDGGSWPACQNLSAPDDELGTWSVTVLQGTPIPAGGEVMAGLLLCELAKACVNDDSCRLPRRIQNITRQGVSINFADVFESIGAMRTGLFEVDLWIESARTTMGSGASVSSVDLPRPSVLTWPLPEHFESS